MSKSREAWVLTIMYAKECFANTTSFTSHSTRAQTQPCSATAASWQLGLAAGIPIMVALVLAVLLALTCLRQRAGCRGNQAHQCEEGQEGCGYEQTLPEFSKGQCASMGNGSPRLYENEAQKPPCQQPAPTPRKPPGVRNAKLNAPPARQQPLAATDEALYETCVPSPITRKKANSVDWD